MNYMFLFDFFLQQSAKRAYSKRPCRCSNHKCETRQEEKQTNNKCDATAKSFGPNLYPSRIIQHCNEVRNWESFWMLHKVSLENVSSDLFLFWVVVGFFVGVGFKTTSTTSRGWKYACMCMRRRERKRTWWSFSHFCKREVHFRSSQVNKDFGIYHCLSLYMVPYFRVFCYIFRKFKYFTFIVLFQWGR